LGRVFPKRRRKIGAALVREKARQDDYWKEKTIFVGRSWTLGKKKWRGKKCKGWTRENWGTGKKGARAPDRISGQRAGNGPRKGRGVSQGGAKGMGGESISGCWERGMEQYNAAQKESSS